MVGDDLMERLGELNAQGVTLDNMEDGSAFGPIRDRVSSANAYYGAWPVAEALASGAQIVVAVTHMDMRDDRALAEHADVDVILGGHEHEPLIAEEGKTLITKAGSDARLAPVRRWASSVCSRSRS